MDKNGVDSGLARLTPISEMDGYLNRESPVYCIIDDGDGEFHLRLNPSDPSALWKKNATDPSSMICSLENGFESATDLTKECNEFFSEHSVDAPRSASCDGITNYGGTINDAKNEVIAEVVVKGGDVDAAMENHAKTTQDIVNEILGELNAQ